MIRFGIVGAGRIARKFATDIEAVNNAIITAVASRSMERANAFKEEFNLDVAFDSYKEMAKSNVVDAVYVATPHTYHKEHSILFLNNNKHVLCEKPIAVNTSEYKEMIEAAKSNKKVLMEAMWTRFLPVYRHLKTIIDTEKYGKILSIKADFGVPLTINANPKGRILNPDLAGGGLLDIGIYPLSVFKFITKEPISSMICDASFTDTGVDESVNIDIVLDNEQKTTVILRSDISQDFWNSLVIQFENGMIEIPHFWYGDRIITSEEVLDFPFKIGGFEYEIEHFVNTVESGQLEDSIMTYDESLEVMELMDHIREVIGLTYPFE